MFRGRVVDVEFDAVAYALFRVQQGGEVAGPADGGQLHVIHLVVEGRGVQPQTTLHQLRLVADFIRHDGLGGGGGRGRAEGHIAGLNGWRAEARSDAAIDLGVVVERVS